MCARRRRQCIRCGAVSEAVCHTPFAIHKYYPLRHLSCMVDRSLRLHQSAVWTFLEYIREKIVEVASRAKIAPQAGLKHSEIALKLLLRDTAGSQASPGG